MVSRHWKLHIVGAPEVCFHSMHSVCQSVLVLWQDTIVDPLSLGRSVTCRRTTTWLVGSENYIAMEPLRSAFILCIRFVNQWLCCDNTALVDPWSTPCRSVARRRTQPQPNMRLHWIQRLVGSEHYIAMEPLRSTFILCIRFINQCLCCDSMALVGGSTLCRHDCRSLSRSGRRDWLNWIQWLVGSEHCIGLKPLRSAFILFIRFVNQCSCCDNMALYLGLSAYQDLLTRVPQLQQYLRLNWIQRLIGNENYIAMEPLRSALIPCIRFINQWLCCDSRALVGRSTLGLHDLSLGLHHL